MSITWKWQPRVPQYSVTCQLPSGLGDVVPVLLAELDSPAQEGGLLLGICRMLHAGHAASS